jgi:hypothetical protein
MRHELATLFKNTKLNAGCTFGLVLCLMGMPSQIHAETSEEWVKLGARVHGGFDSHIALGIRIGIDARRRLGAGPRQLRIEYQDGPSAPCSCVVDGIMLATVSTPGQGFLHVSPAGDRIGRLWDRSSQRPQKRQGGTLCLGA